MIWSSSLGLVRFQIFLMMARNSSLHVSMLPVTLICRLVRTSANSVALNMTVPSLLSGIFMETSFLQAIRCGHSLPKPSGGEILRNNVITSKCLIRPLYAHKMTLILLLSGFKCKLSRRSTLTWPLDRIRTRAGQSRPNDVVRE